MGNMKKGCLCLPGWYVGVAPQDGNKYTLVIDDDVNNNDNDVTEEEEV